MIGMDPRPLTPRERAVLDTLLGSTDGALRSQAADVRVVGTCGCGCPSIDFEPGYGLGMTVRADAVVRGTHAGLFLYSVKDQQRGEVLGGIEWDSVEDTDPPEFPSHDLLDIQPRR